MEYFEYLEDLLMNGATVTSRGEETKELLNKQLTINYYNYPSTEKSRNIEKTLEYFTHEIAWYLSGDRGSQYIEKYAKLWGEIKNNDQTLNSNYGNLIYYRRNVSVGYSDRQALTSFDWALSNLLKDKNTRKALMLYNDRCFNYLTNKDYICSQYQHFLIRDEKLICFVGLRSSDAIFGLQYNMPWWSIVQQDLRLKLLGVYPDLKLGEIIVTINSGHLYKQHYKLAENMLKEEKERYFIKLLQPIKLGKNPHYYHKNFYNYFKIAKV